MMSLTYIREQNAKVAKQAAEEQMEPYVYFRVEDVRGEGGFPFPYIGDFRPEGWELVDTHFVDSSGFGADYEPALSVRQFIDLIEERIRESSTTVGWAIIEAGQFQVYVGEFERA